MARSTNTVRFRGQTYAGGKKGLAGYLSRNRNSDAKRVSTHDRMFTVAKIRPIQNALRFETKLANCSASVNNEFSNWKLANGNRICKFRKKNRR